MQVSYELKPSSIAGLGLFAKERIAKGALLWKYGPESVRTYANADEVRAELARRSDDAIIHFLEHAYCWDGHVCEILDDGRFWNHSKAPNTGTLDEDPASSFALRDIEPGEELLDDYSQHDMLDWFETICREYNVSSSSAVGLQFD